MPYIALNAKSYEGKVVGNGDCPLFVEAAAKTPKTYLWKEGEKVWKEGEKGSDSNIQMGTAIATFQDKEYKNRTNGDSHAAIYIGQDRRGIYVWDQWKGHPVSTRLIFFRYGKGHPCDDGCAFAVIEMK